jgi:hypothetical protein
MAKILSSLFSHTKCMVLPEHCNCFFFIISSFQIDIPKNSDMIETFQCTTLATSRYVVLGPLALQPLHSRCDTDSSESLICGFLDCDTTFSRNNYFSPKEISASVFRMKVISALKIFLQNISNYNKNTVS